MAERVSFDTCFLIDIQKEVGEARKGPAHRFLQQHSEAIMLLSAVALGEFSEGFESPQDPNLHGMLTALEILEIDSETSLIYGAITRRLRKVGQLIGSNDLWIGSSALRHRVPLVTRNAEHFRRIADLALMEY